MNPSSAQPLQATQTNMKRTVGPLVGIIVALAVGIIVGMSMSYFTYYQTKPKNILNVQGIGSIVGKPDSAQIYISVTNLQASNSGQPAEQLVQVNTNANQLVNSLTAIGISLKEINVFGMNLPQADVTVTLDKGHITLVDDVVNIVKNTPTAHLKNGAITPTNYIFKNWRDTEKQAHDLAIKDGRKQIENIAKINHKQVGEIISIEDLERYSSDSNVYDSKADLFTNQKDHTFTVQVNFKYTLTP